LETKKKQKKLANCFVILLSSLQCCIRRRLARRVYRALRADANSLQKFKEVSYKLENKVVELIQTITAKENSIKTLEEERLTMEQQARKTRKKQQQVWELDFSLLCLSRSPSGKRSSRQSVISN